MNQEEAARVMLEKFEIVLSMFHGFDYTPFVEGRPPCLPSGTSASLRENQ